MGFDYFDGFLGGETDQWTPYLFRNTEQVFPVVGHPDYNLTTDLADDAIQHIQQLNATAPDKPFFVYYVSGGTHSPHQPTKEWIDKISAMHLLDKAGMRCERKSWRTRRHTAGHAAHALARRVIAIASLFAAALAVSGAIFLILEMYTPFTGLIQISNAPLRSALAHLGP
jgi:Sulfatase